MSYSRSSSCPTSRAALTVASCWPALKLPTSWCLASTVGPGDELRNAREARVTTRRTRGNVEALDNQSGGSCSCPLVEELPAFEPWVLARRGVLLRTAWLLTGDVASAEDLLQTALLRCWPRWCRISRMDDIDAYVRRVMLRCHLTSRRRHWCQEMPAEVLPDRAAPAPADDRDEVLLTALNRLPRSQRAVVVLRFGEDLSRHRRRRPSASAPAPSKARPRALRSLRTDPGLTAEHRTGEGKWTTRT